MVTDNFDNEFSEIFKKTAEQIFMMWNTKSLSDTIKRLSKKYSPPASKSSTAFSESQIKSAEQNTISESKETKLQDPIGNGGSTKDYTWTQTLDSIDLYMPIKFPYISTNDIKVIFSKNVKMAILNKGDIIKDELQFSNEIVQCQSFWTIEDSNLIHLYLEKRDKMKWWDCVFLGDPQIDIKKIQPQNSKLSDLDTDLRQTVEKMLADQSDKMKCPSNVDQHKLLQNFKNQHPQFDFSNAKVHWN